MSALLLLAGAGLMHPLMAFGGALVFAGWWTVERLGWRWTLIACAALAAGTVAVLAYPPLGTRLFGPMDGDWRDCARRAVPMNFPSEWSFLDWLHLAAGLFLAFVIGLDPCRGSGGPAHRPLRARRRRRVGDGGGRHDPGRLAALRLAAPGPALPRPVAAAPDAGAVRPPAGGRPLAAEGRPRQTGCRRRRLLFRRRLLQLPGIRRHGLRRRLATAVFYYRATFPGSARAGLAAAEPGGGRRRRRRRLGDAATRFCLAMRARCSMSRIPRNTLLPGAGLPGFRRLGGRRTGVGLAGGPPASARVGASPRPRAGRCLAYQIAALTVLNVWEVPVRPTSDLQFVGRFLEKHAARRATRFLPSTARSASLPTCG